MALERDKHVAQRAMLTLDEAQLLDVYRKMVTIRRFEEKAAEMYTKGKITGFCHLYAGEEAVAVGAIQALYDKDYVVSTYREHGHCIAKGAEPRVVMAELFGKETGISHGRGGSMHLFDPVLRFMGGYAIVGGGLPIAAGPRASRLCTKRSRKSSHASLAMARFRRARFTNRLIWRRCGICR